MRVRFFLKESPRPRDAAKQVEYVEIHTGRDGADTVVRPATVEDSAAYPAEYRAFLSPPAEVAPESAPPAAVITPPPEVFNVAPPKEDEVPADTVVDKPSFFTRKRK